MVFPWFSQLRNAQKLGGIPIYFSEYWMPNVTWFAGGLAVACNEGCNATTYWQPLGVSWILGPAVVGVDDEPRVNVKKKTSTVWFKMIH